MATEGPIVIRPSGTEDLAQDPAEARKALEAIDIRLTNKPISLLQHKIYNVWVAFAQSTANATDVRIFDFPLSEVMELCGFDSNNHAYFIDAAREMLDLRVEYNSMGRYPASAAALEGIAEQGEGGKGKRGKRGTRPALKWSAAQLVSYIEIDSGTNRMRIEFPEILRQQILRPDFYRVVDLRKQQLFTSRAGLTLYEYVLRFADQQSTPWLSWESYSMLLSGSTEPHNTFRDFSKMLTRAIEQVNAHHDSHQVHAEFTKRGRAIEKMRVVIGLRSQAQLPLTPAEELPLELIRAMTAIGLTTREAANLAAAHTRPYVEAQLAYVRRRLNDQSRGSLKVPAAYLRAAIAGNYAQFNGGAIDPTVSVPAESSRQAVATAVASIVKPVTSGQGRADSGRAAEIGRVREWYGTQPDERKVELSAAFFADATPIVRKALSTKGLSSPVAANAFYGWLLDRGEYVTP